MAIDTFVQHPLVRLLGKPASDFTRADLVRACEQLEIRLLALRYVADDGRLKSLQFAIHSREHLEDVLSRGERVDGSNLFGDADTDASDAYAVPRHHTAFINPFTIEPSLDMLCGFYDERGRPLPYAPERVVRRAAQALEDETGMVLEAFGEVEFYLVEDAEELFPVEDDRGYQESRPFSKRKDVRDQVALRLVEMGVPVKYVHGEVGNFIEDGRQYVQGEIELLPQPVAAAADSIVLTKWVVREVAYAAGLDCTFAPAVGSAGAGNGLHVHSRLVRGGRNAMVRKEGINDTGRRLVAGYLELARSLTAFGNTVPTSYLRLADGEESPGAVCWGEHDRTGLVRVPLGWEGDVTELMAADANPLDAPPQETLPSPATVELRVGDGSADVHGLLAGMAVAARRGLTDEGALERAEALLAGDGDDTDDFEQLPDSCDASADALERDRAAYEADGVFPSRVIDMALERLRSHTHSGPVTDLDADARSELVRRYWHRA